MRFCGKILSHLCSKAIVPADYAEDFGPDPPGNAEFQAPAKPKLVSMNLFSL